MITEKECINCNLIKSINDFYFNKRGNRYFSSCKKCHNKQNRSEDKIIYNNEYRKIHKKKTMLYSACYRAKKENLPFNLIEEDIVIPEFCPILGIKLEINIGCHKDNSPSLDKVIPELGYTKGNVKVISKKANLMKRNLTFEQLEKIMKYIKENTKC